MRKNASGKRTADSLMTTFLDRNGGSRSPRLVPPGISVKKTVKKRRKKMQTDDSILRRELLSICITKKEKKTKL